MFKRLTALLLVLSCVAALAALCRTAEDAVASVIPPGPSMITPRAGHWLVRDAGGSLFAIGGYNATGVAQASVDVLAASDSSFDDYSLLDARLFSACARLADGAYLLAGGAPTLSMNPAKDTAEVFNPTTKTSAPTTFPMVHARTNATAATLASGKVFIVGGSGDVSSSYLPEVYNPATNQFYVGPSLVTPRSAPIVLPASDGRAVVLGGFSLFGGPTPESVEIYDPVANLMTKLRDTLFPGESGWIAALAPGLGWGSQPIAAQRAANGKYYFLANKNVGIFTYYAVFSFDPGTLEIAKLNLSPALPTRNPVDYRYNLSLLPHPMLSPSGETAYVMAELFDGISFGSYAYAASSTNSSQILYYQIDLATNAVIKSDVRALPTERYVSMAAHSQADASRFFIAGGAAYGYGKLAGGRAYGGYGYQHYTTASSDYAQAATFFDAIALRFFKGISSILLLLQE